MENIFALNMFQNGSTDNVNSRDRFGQTALHFAAESNDETLVAQLLDRGANVDAEDIVEDTPLHLAAMDNNGSSHYRVIETLLKSGANVNAANNVGYTPLFWLAIKGSFDLVQLYLNFNPDVNLTFGGGCNILFPAICYEQDVDVVQLLIDFGIDVNHGNDEGEVPLHCACARLSNKKFNLIKCLLKNNANANAAASDGLTPLIHAVDNKLGKKTMKKYFFFLMEHTDFNVTRQDVNIFTYYDKPLLEYLWKMILEHLAKLEILEIPVNSVYLNIISGKKEFNNYYKLCQAELLTAKNTKLINSWLTYLNLLVDSRKNLKNYARNKDFIKVFKKSDCKNNFPIYGAIMNKNLSKGIERRKLMDKSASVLSNCLPIFSPTHLVIRDTLDCIMSSENLSVFCKSFQKYKL